MQEVRITEIIEKLETRADNRASSEFIKIFSRIVKDYLAYKRWVEMMIDKNGCYQQKGREHILQGFCDYIALIDDIAQNGIRNPIREMHEDPFGYEIDGYHRMIIWKELGHETIHVANRPS